MCFKLFNASSAFSNGGIFERRLNVVNDCLNAPAVASGNKEDNDGLNDRRNDLTYHDKTEYDQKVANVVTDYVDFVKALISLTTDAITEVGDTEKNKELKRRLAKIKETPAISEKREPEKKERPRTYEDMLKGRFRLESVVTIERTYDANDISYKWEDLTLKSVESLIVQGIEDAKKALK